jgi:hypothetical protein
LFSDIFDIGNFVKKSSDEDEKRGYKGRERGELHQRMNSIEIQIK